MKLFLILIMPIIFMYWAFEFTRNLMKFRKPEEGDDKYFLKANVFTDVVIILFIYLVYTFIFTSF